MKDEPTNQFVAEVSIPFPNGKQGRELLLWHNLQNCGKKSVPIEEPISAEHLGNAYRLRRNRVFKFVFEITKEGDWRFVGRKAD